LLVGDEPNDIVFAGPGGARAFITTAYRGQNLQAPLDVRGEFAAPGVGRALVWVFNALSLGTTLGGTPVTVVELFGDKPRALAVSPDGGTVYAGIFRSGNQTTTILEGLVCDTSAFNMANDFVQPGCSVAGQSMPGGYPPPHHNHEGFDRPEVGLIVKLNRDGGTSDTWQDELGRSWNNAVRFNLPDIRSPAWERFSSTWLPIPIRRAVLSTSPTRTLKITSVSRAPAPWPPASSPSASRPPSAGTCTRRASRSSRTER
jgi:hypothetical protein